MLSRPLDVGLSELTKIVFEMADLAERTVSASIEAYVQGATIDIQIRAWSDALRSLHDNLEEKAIRLIALHQPVASDLRAIKSSMKIAYDLSRFGRYALDISTLLSILQANPQPTNGAVAEMGKKTLESLRMGIEVFKTKDFGLMDKLTDLESEIDKMYRAYLRDAVDKPPERIQILVSNVLVFRHLERIADHACYIAEETYYMVHGRTMYVR